MPKKLRDLELKAGHKPARGQKGTAHAYNLKSQRDQERRWVEQAEAAYARFVAGWKPTGPKARTGAAKKRSDDKGCAAGLTPRALLFAARSSVRDGRLAVKQQGPSIAQLGAVLGMVKTKPAAAVVCGQS